MRHRTIAEVETLAEEARAVGRPLAFGVVMVASSSIAIGENHDVGAFYFLNRHLLFVALGLGLAFAATRVELKWLDQRSQWLLLGCFALLLPLSGTLGVLALLVQMGTFWQDRNWLLLVLDVIILVAAVWVIVEAVGAMVRASRGEVDDDEPGFLASYRILWVDLKRLWRRDPRTVKFLVASAIFRDGLAGVFTFGAVLGVNVYEVSQADVLLFGVALTISLLFPETSYFPLFLLLGHDLVVSLYTDDLAVAALAGTLLLFAGLRERLAVADVPESFQGAPVALVTAGVMSLAFLGFAGLA